MGERTGVRIVNLNRADRRLIPGRGETVPLVDAGVGARHLDVHVNILAPGGTGGAYHAHPENENVYVVLRGTGRFVAEGREYLLRADDVVFIPPGVKHSLSAHGSDDLVLVEIYAPLPVRKIDLDSPDGASG